MIYMKLLLILSLIALSQSYTDITLLNCPSQFNITTSNVTTDQSAATLGSFLYSSFQSPSQVARVQNIVITGNTADLQKYISSLMVPYIIYGVCFILFFLVVSACCLFDRSCPPCLAIRRDLNLNPYTKTETRITMVLTLLFALGAITTTIIAFSFIPLLKENLSMSSCSIYLAIDTAINGDGIWGGFVNLRDQVGNITNLLASAVTQIQIYFPGDSWLTDSMSAMRTANLNIYKEYKNSQLITPNPATTATAQNANQDVPMINSNFIQNTLGPNGTAGTMTSDIDLGLRTTANLSQQGVAVEQSASILTASLNTIINNSAASQNTLLMYSHQLDVMETQFDTLATQYFVNDFSTAISVFEGIFGVVLTGGLLVLLGVISTHFFDIFICRRMVHLGWVIFGLIYSGVIVITFVLLSVGSIGFGFCNYFQLMLTEPASFDRLNAAYTQNAFGRIDVCLFGDGNALEKFSLSQEMNTVTQLFTNIQTYFDYTTSSSTNYVNLAISTGKITSWIGVVNGYKIGETVDYDPTATSDDNPNFAISSLNLYTYQGGGVPTGSMDVWVWDVSLCTDPTQIIYTAGVNPGTTLSTTSVTCISFNQKLQISSSSIWTVADFTSRYVQIRQGYPAAYSQISAYGPTLIAFRDSRINLFQAIQDDLNALLTSNTNFNSQLAGFLQRVNQFYSSVSTLNNLVTNPLSGLLVSSNCNSLGDKIRFTYNIFCVNFMAQIVKMCVCSLVLLVLMFGAVFLGSRFGMIYAQIQKQNRINMPDESATEKDIQMDKQDTTSSNSNDQD